MADTTSESMKEEMKKAEKAGTVELKQGKKPTSQNYTHTFSRPVEIEGTEYKTMTFYFENLTGYDIEAIEEELQDEQRYVLSPEISSIFQSALAARAAGIASDEIKRLPVGDYMKIKNRARDFLISVGY